LFIHSRGFVAPARAREGGSEARSDFEPFGVNSLDLEAEIRTGTREDAIDYACSAVPNSKHGLREKPEDRHRRVDTMIRKHADWSNQTVADHCGVSRETVRRISDLQNVQVERPAERTGRDGRTINTANIGRAPRPAVDGMALEEERESE
jgi:hypothetical protein